MIRESLYSDPPRNGDGPSCPRCDAQIVVWPEDWWTCSVCALNSLQWELMLDEQATHVKEQR